MKRVNIFLRLTLIVVAFIYSCNVFAQSELIFQGVTYTLYSDNTAIVKKVSPKKEYVVIPSIVKNNGRIYTVTEIGKLAFFEFGENLTKTVVLPNSIIKIGDDAFSNSHRLTKVVIPNSVKEIGSSAFLSCNNLKCIELPNKLKIIKEDTFHSCTSLESITIPFSVESIESYAFAACHNLETVYVLNNNTQIATNAILNENTKVIGGGVRVSMKKVTMIPVFDTNGNIIRYREYKDPNN